MERDFSYLPTTAYVENIHIGDIGNSIIEAKNDDQVFYYLTISTEFGLSRICEFGPIVDGLQYDIKKFSFTFNKTEYTEAKLIKRIEMFLKNPAYQITEAKEITLDELEQYCDIAILNYVSHDRRDKNETTN